MPVMTAVLRAPRRCSPSPADVQPTSTLKSSSPLSCAGRPCGHGPSSGGLSNRSCSDVNTSSTALPVPQSRYR